jgi:hypothetical protein
MKYEKRGVFCEKKMQLACCILKNVHVMVWRKPVGSRKFAFFAVREVGMTCSAGHGSRVACIPF